MTTGEHVLAGLGEAIDERFRLGNLTEAEKEIALAARSLLPSSSRI